MPENIAPKHAFVEDCDSDSDVHPSNPPPPSPKVKPKPASKPPASKPRPVRPPSNHSDSGYSSRTAATVGSGESSKGSGKKIGTLRVDTTAGRPNADLAPKEKGNGTSKGKSSEPSGRPAPQQGPTQRTTVQREVTGPESTVNRQQHPTAFQYPTNCPAPSPWHMQFAAQHSVPPQQPMHGPLPPGPHGYPTPTTSFPPSVFPPTGPTDAPIPRPRRHSLAMAGPRPASYHPGTSSSGYWVDLNSGTPVESSPSPMFPPTYSPSGLISSSYPTQRVASIVPQRTSGPSQNQMSLPAPQQRPVLLHRSTTQSRPPSMAGPGQMVMYEGNQTQPTRAVRPASQMYPDSYMARLPDDRALMPPPPRPTAQPIVIQQQQPTSAISRRNSSAPQALPHHVWAQAEAGYLDGDETIRPLRKESKRPSVIDFRSTSYQAPVPAKRPSKDRSPSRSSGYTTQNHPGYESRAELDKRRALDAEAYMGRTSGRPDKKDSRPSKETGRTHSATTGQPLTARALEKRTSSGTPREAPSGTHSRSHSYGHGYSKSRSSSKDEDNSRMSQASTGEASGAVKIRLPAKERLDLEFSGGMDGRTISYGPTDEVDGMAELVIGDRAGEMSQGQARRGSVASSAKGSFAERSAKMSSKGSEKARKTKKSTADGNKISI